MTTRLFVAIPLDAELLMESLIPVRKFAAVKGIRFMPASNLHITQFFIGDVPVESRQEIISTAGRVCSRLPAYLLVANRFVFAPERHPSMIWLSLAPNPAFVNANSIFSDSLAPFLPQVPRFPEPVPHITIARLRRSFKSGQLVLPQLSQEIIQEVNRLELWETLRTVGGVTYKRVAGWELRNNQAG